MKANRGLTPSGEFRTIRTQGENFRAFIPAKLVGTVPYKLTPNDLLLNDEARAACARLDGLAQIIPDVELFVLMYLRKEALLSAQIEGTQSSLSDVLLFENEEAEDEASDAVEVVDYIRALRHGIARLPKLPLSGRLLNEIHKRLLASGRGRERGPGEFRRTQNWIGGTRPGNARYVPPPAGDLHVCIRDFEEFLNDPNPKELPLVRVARIHAQFETIHPYLDGNGRLGRLLITLCLIEYGVISQPLLYLSLYLKRHRDAYYEMLQRTRTHSEWNQWIRFFLEGVRDTALQASQTAQSIVARFKEDRATIDGSKRGTAAVRRLHEELQRAPMLTITRAMKLTGYTHPTLTKSFGTLESLGIVREISGRQRGRTFEYRSYLRLLDDGTEPLRRAGARTASDVKPRRSFRSAQHASGENQLVVR